MGITKLSDLIRGDAPASISHKEIGDYSGKIIALDTSIIVNQFRSAVPNLKLSLLGVFYRTLTFLEHDIKPVFVFDGDPPEQKRAVLERRAQSAGWSSTQRPHTALLQIRPSVSSKTKEFLRLLQLLGVPCVQAPGDAEACCAQLVRSGVVDAVASEDMDTLAFGGTLLLRQLNAKRQSEVMEFSLPKILQILQLTQEEIKPVCTFTMKTPLLKIKSVCTFTMKTPLLKIKPVCMFTMKTPLLKIQSVCTFTMKTPLLKIKPVCMFTMKTPLLKIEPVKYWENKVWADEIKLNSLDAIKHSMFEGHTAHQPRNT
ncbi:putative flap endonuclease 1-like [Silurus asotus]|uniref:Flap endonuclease 1-like n=1 Tax=Silurus asotus TaxID=30991 RepID=A0AAD5F9Z3_SILAS|nr:putative flap endonuclease 1-like [Silurus asotus]